MSDPLSPRIVAVVVTFNRRALLERLLDELQATAGLAEIVVVDNASTDGTADWVRSLVEERGTSVSKPSVPVHLVALDTNTGGAGGFHTGMETAVAVGADLVWLMDDDGLPDKGCLATLLEHHGELDFWGPVVVDEEQPERLVFPIRVPGGATLLRTTTDIEAAAVDGLIRDVVIPFNGVLVTRELIERIGLVREDYFIWGDDHEYRLRAEKAGARIATVAAALVKHPSVGDLGSPMAFGRMTYNHTPSDLKHYCMARNNLINLRTYRGPLHALAFVAKTAWFYSFTRPSLSRLRLSAIAMWAGLRGDFTGHRRFLA